MYKTGAESDYQYFTKIRLLFEGDLSDMRSKDSNFDNFLTYFDDVHNSSNSPLDSIDIEMFGPWGDSAVECTMVINAYTKIISKHYKLQISSIANVYDNYHNTNYNTSGWQIVPKFVQRLDNTTQTEIIDLLNINNSAKSGISFDTSNGTINASSITSSTSLSILAAKRSATSGDETSLHLGTSSTNKILNIYTTSGGVDYFDSYGTFNRFRPTQAIELAPTSAGASRIELAINTSTSTSNLSSSYNYIKLSCYQPDSASGNEYKNLLSGINVTYSGITITGSVSCNSSVEASYFNATSDKRLKQNINLFPETVKASDILDKMNIYTYEFIAKPEEKHIGVIAQEVAEFDVDGADFVSINNDGYYSVKESKLLYLTMKALKEQMAEIELLKQEIKELKKRV
jgi:hypothetical protein